MIRFRTAALAAAASLLVGCTATDMASNTLDLDNDGNGRFSGHAGMDYTEAQLRGIVGQQICGGPPPREFVLQVLSNRWLFSGTC
ncbi:hypothetical protein [Paragemmobacter ruber]|uniref:Lipoprotein n=1 Tax=Paragemmobacter ruber TaxID=1985673 RepID=A0ABW9Y7F4_9RHOB|nr:hypothetical protein [Rhodobacter ruber]NBE08129.1 hypothetical protein [Rhodobacter ruber]